MKRNVVLALVLVFALVEGLYGASGNPNRTKATPSVVEQSSGGVENSKVKPDTASTLAPLVETTIMPMLEETSSLPKDLPGKLATPEDLTGKGGYLLLAEIPEEDIALYCDNLEERNQVYIRYGEHFQAFDQQVWTDPTVLPELTWGDWDEDGKQDLSAKYLWHEGIYFDGEKTSPGLVYEFVVYQWEKEQWTDIHFTSGGPKA